MSKLSNEFLITHVFSLSEVGFWAILSKFHHEDEIIPKEFLDKFFSLEQEELNHFLERMIQSNIIKFVAPNDASWEKPKDLQIVLCRSLKI